MLRLVARRAAVQVPLLSAVLALVVAGATLLGGGVVVGLAAFGGGVSVLENRPTTFSLLFCSK